MSAATDRWCVLRMAGPRTLPVVRWLLEAGVDAWTPTAKRRRTLPRSTKYRDIEAAVLPTLAFARYDDLPRLCAVLVTPGSDHPAFSIFSHRGSFPAVSDDALQPLRDHETLLAKNWDAFVKSTALKRSRKKKKGRGNPRRAYVMGQRVKAPDTPCEGLIGEVVEVRNNGDLVIAFGGLIDITINACSIEPIHLELPEPDQGTAARAA